MKVLKLSNAALTEFLNEIPLGT